MELQVFHLKWGEKEFFTVHERDRWRAIDQCIIILKQKGYRNVLAVDFEDAEKV